MPGTGDRTVRPPTARRRPIYVADLYEADQRGAPRPGCARSSCAALAACAAAPSHPPTHPRRPRRVSPGPGYGRVTFRSGVTSRVWFQHYRRLERGVVDDEHRDLNGGARTEAVDPRLPQGAAWRGWEHGVRYASRMLKRHNSVKARLLASTKHPLRRDELLANALERVESIRCTQGKVD